MTVPTGRDALFEHTGVVTKYFRPPLGVISPAVLPAVVLCRHRILRWSLNTGEYSYLRGASSSDLADNFERRLHDRAIVLSHDDHAQVPEMLARILPVLVQRGVDLSGGLRSLGH